jgi:sodium/hydrogen antiporter
VVDSVVWFLVVGALLVGMALTGSVLQRLPLTAAMFYLAAGVGLGPAGLGLLTIDVRRHAGVLEVVTEVAVLVSLFGAGLKLRVPLTDWRWWLPVRLAVGSMAVTVGLVALVGVYGLGLPLGAAVLLGAVLAPTDPVLAGDVQVADPFDRDRLRFSLTGEAGLNDGTAFPFVLLGLGLLGLHDLGAGGWRWVAVDVVWAVGAGLGVGWVLGVGVGRLVLYLRRHHREAVGLDDLLALGLIALAYGVALLAHGYGFLAVFAAGLALRRVEREATGDVPPEEARTLTRDGAPADLAVDPAKGAAYLAEAVLGFSAQLGRIAEVAVVLVLGSLLTTPDFAPRAWLVVLALLVVIRPAAVWVGLLGTKTSRLQRRLVGWFGIRGVGSVYYLAFAITHGLPADLADELTHLVLAVVTVSVVVHGVSVTPLMNFYVRVRGAPPAATSVREPPPGFSSPA